MFFCLECCRLMLLRFSTGPEELCCEVSDRRRNWKLLCCITEVCYFLKIS